MPSEYDDDLLHWAIIYIKGNEMPQAKRILQRALDVSEDPEIRTKASYLMSLTCSDPAEKRSYLEDTLAWDPTHPEARRALAILDGKLRPDEVVNADALPAQVPGIEKAAADRFTCPKCGARMVFDGDGKTLYCEHCDRTQILGKSAPQAGQDFILAMATAKGHRAPIMTRTFNCQGCGALFILPAHQISTVCAYCGSPHVVALDKELIQPDSIIPMAMNKEQALQAMNTWLDKHGPKMDASLQEPRGLYLPVWSFDFLGTLPWNGMVYHDKQKIPVRGEQNASFDHIYVPGDGRMKELIPKVLSGLDTDNIPAYDERFLAGWPAEVNEQSMAEASLDARQQVVERAHANIQADHGQIEDLSYSTANISVLSFRLILFPVWYSVYQSDGRDHRVLVNGQTGKVYGETRHEGLLGWLENAIGM